MSRLTKKSILHTTNHKATIKTYKHALKLKKGNIHVGSHTSIVPSILTGLQYIKEIGGNSAQIFLGSNSSASLKLKTKLTPTDITEIKKYVKQNKVQLIVHSIYLLNFAFYPPFSGRNKYAHENLQHDLKYAALLGAKCVVLHFGFRSKKMPSGEKVTLDLQTSLNIMATNVNYILSKAPKNIRLALETSAGYGSQVGSSLSDIKYVWDKIYDKYKKKQIGICIDTAHIFVSGYDISNVNGMRDYLEEFDKLIGIKYITNLHINDSRYELGSKHDEHRGLQHGKIFSTGEGLEALKYLIKFCTTHKIPMILETHGAAAKDKAPSKNSPDSTYTEEIQLIKSLV